MKITVCIGSSCHIKGSRKIAERIQQLINDNNLADKIELCGTFCMENCQNGVSVTLDEKLYSLTPDTTDDFFKNEILKSM